MLPCDLFAQGRVISCTKKRTAMQFHVLALEGPKDWARAAAIASRVTGLARALADPDHEIQALGAYGRPWKA
jgi:hypothetical protein